MSDIFTIGQLSALTGCKVPTIRWYEQQGLLPPASRSAGNQRRYNQQHLALLRFIRHARTLGFDLAAIRQLLQLSSHAYRDHLEADRLARQHHAAVQRKIRQLQALEAELARMITDCRYDEEQRCQILEVLANHDLCAAEHPSILD